MSKEKNAFDNILIVMILAHHHKKPKNKGLDKLPFFFTIRTCEHFSPPFFLLRQIGDLSGGARDYSQTPPIFTQKKERRLITQPGLWIYIWERKERKERLSDCVELNLRRWTNDRERHYFFDGGTLSEVILQWQTYSLEVSDIYWL